MLRSRIQIFRDMLAMAPEERAKALERFPVERRKLLMEKLVAYEAMPPGERENVLRTTELGDYLMMLMRMPATNRLEQLSQVPESIRSLVGDRLLQWDQLAPEQQKEVLEYQSTRQYFVPQAANQAGSTSLTNPVVAVPNELIRSVERWNTLSPGQKEEVRGRFEQFFSLSANERQQSYQTLSRKERMQMTKSLHDFSQLPEARREQCLKAFTKFASLSKQDRDEFLKNVERWNEMSDSERQAWRNLVQRIPKLPPFPGSPPPLPPANPRAHPIFPGNRALAETNSGN